MPSHTLDKFGIEKHAIQPASAFSRLYFLKSALDVNLERLLKEHGQLQNGMPRVLELNPSHQIAAKLAERVKDAEAESDELLKDAAHLLLDQARIVEGEDPANPSEFVHRLGAVLVSLLNYGTRDRAILLLGYVYKSFARDRNFEFKESLLHFILPIIINVLYVISIVKSSWKHVASMTESTK